jgi:DNA primase
VRRTGRLLVVEGYTDVMAAHQAGWKSAVAVLGTATTEDHAALIRRSGARDVVLVFDGDEAGRKAAARALLGLLRLPVQLSVAVLPEGRDPGDLLVESDGAQRFREAIEGARDWFDWSLQGLVGRRGPDLARAVEERFHLLSALERPLERSSRLAEMARFLALPEADVRAQWALFQRSQRPAVAAPVPAVVRTSAPSAGNGRERAFESLLGALLLDNSLVPVHGHWFEHCPPGDVRCSSATSATRAASRSMRRP